MTATRKLEFIAKTITDVGKAVFVVGLASSFFAQFSLVWRLTISILSVAFVVGGVALYPEEGESE